MSSSMRRAERARRSHRLRLLLAGLAVVPAPSPVHAATPVLLAPCQIGAIRLTHDMTLAPLLASLRRSFPNAVWTQGSAYDGGSFRDVRVRERGEALMTVVYYPGTRRRVIARVDLTSSRFQLAPGVRPGTLLTDVRALGPVMLGYNPTNGVEDVDAPKVEAVLNGWEPAGCSVNLRVGPGKVGMYARHSYETRRFRPGAKIALIEVAP